MAAATDARPDPDRLLELVKRDEAKATRGKLRIYFGASAGVGKTYAMLMAARKTRDDGRDVVIGVLETHGRTETAALLEGFEVLPLANVAHRERTLKEFDLDAAIARRPSLMLVDELAHTNAAGARHPKRWQDIDELLAHGIDVYSTLNVQHLDSLNDVVGGITGVRVWETVPDKVFDAADEVIVVDLPADELLARLKSGKVYMPDQAERAAKNFFRKGNLIALRELALRRTADRVEEDVQAYRSDAAIDKVWKTDATLLCCVGPQDSALHVVRSTARLASQLNIGWVAAYVETPALQRLSPEQRQRVLGNLALAESLGASTTVLTGPDAVAAIVEYARERNISRLVTGRSAPRPFRLAIQDFGARLARAAPEIDVIDIGAGTQREKAEPGGAGVAQVAAPMRKASTLRRYALAMLVVAVATGIAALLHPAFDLANIVMVFLLGVVVAAATQGRGPAIVAAIISVAAFDFIFVPPRLSFAVSDVQYLLTFAVMLVVGLIVAQLTSGLRYQARVASHREDRARALYELARELSAQLSADDVEAIASRSIAGAFKAQVALLRPNLDEQLQPSLVPGNPSIEMGTAQWAFDRGEPAGATTDTLPGSDVLYLPLKTELRSRGVLAIRPSNPRTLMVPEQRRQLETFAALIAAVLERIHFVEVAQNALVTMESERLRNSVLAALSHDLRTPLTALVGLAESLTLAKPPLPSMQAELAESVVEQARRMSALVHNLLDMARIESGEMRLRRQWHPFEEVVGSALASLKLALTGHPIEVDLPRDLPLVEFDAALIERALANLVENAVKYTREGSTIRIEARATEGKLVVSVIDNGPGLPTGREQAIFDKFTRGGQESATPGVGLGLAICRAIVEAHRGTISARNNALGGATFTFTLPLGTPPAVQDAEESVT